MKGDLIMSKDLKEFDNELDVLRSEKASIEKVIMGAEGELGRLRPVLPGLSRSKVDLKKTLKVVGDSLSDAPDYQLLVSREKMLNEKIAENEAALVDAQAKLRDVEAKIHNVSNHRRLIEYVSLEAEKFNLLKKVLGKKLSKRNEDRLRELNAALIKYGRYTQEAGIIKRHMDLIRNNRFGVLNWDD